MYAGIAVAIRHVDGARRAYHRPRGAVERQAPVLDDRPGLVRKAKPLCRIYERDMAAYALLRGIDYIYDECPHAEGSNSIYYKEMLNRLESDKPGAKINFYISFLQAKQNGLFAPQADPEAERLHACPSCGQPTTAPGVCSFCRMVDQVVADSPGSELALESPSAQATSR